VDLLVIALLGAIAVGLIAYSVMPRRSASREAVRRRLAGHRGVDDSAALKARARESAAQQLVRKATPVLSKLVVPASAQEQTNLRIKLASAGFRHPQAQTILLASKTLLGIVGLVVGVLFGFSAKMTLPVLFGVATFAAGVGFTLPNAWLMLAAANRKQKIRYGLPDTLDLLVVSVESGLALDAAIKRVGEEMASVHPELSEELRIATMETQMGIPRAEALDNMARRSGVDEMRSLVSVILQAERFGTSIAKALRNQADSLRTKRRQAAEERAQKTAVKLMLPLVLFIFPAMGVVLGGPAVIKMIEALRDNPALGGG